MTVQAKLLSDETVPFACDSSTTLDELRARMQEALGVHAKHLRRLVLNGKELAPPEATLEDLGVTDGATVSIVFDRDFLADDKAEWPYELDGIQRWSTWGQWTDVLTYPADGGKQEKGPLGAKFGNFTSRTYKAYQLAMHGPPGKSGGVYEWRVVLALRTADNDDDTAVAEEAASGEVHEAETVDEERFGGSFVFYCGKAETTGAGLHQRVRQESLGNQGGNMDAFFYAVLGKIERSRTDARFSVKFQARCSAINYVSVVIEDRAKPVNLRRGYFPLTRDGGCSVEDAEKKLLARFDYAACKMLNKAVRLEDFQNWLNEQFARLPRVESVVKPALKELRLVDNVELPERVLAKALARHGLSLQQLSSSDDDDEEDEDDEHEGILCDRAVKKIVEVLENLCLSDCDELAEVLQIAAEEGYKKACIDAKIARAMSEAADEQAR